MKYIAMIPFFALAACDELLLASAPVVQAPIAETPVTLDPTPPPPPPPTARTVEQFDTTTEEDRAAALTVAEPEGGGSLGTTIASLGSAADPGIWIKTPLVDELMPGQVKYQGNTISLELRPSGGVAGSGSQLSLAAMRLLNVPLAGLETVEVFRN